MADMCETERQEIDVSAMKRRLHDYCEAEREIDGQIERMERLAAKMTGIGSPEISDMPKAHNAAADRLADMIAQKDELDASIRAAIQRQSRERNSIEEMLAKLRRADERLVIRMRYIDGQSWGKVNDMMFGNREDFSDRQESYLRRIFRTHGQALYHMAQIVAEEGGHQDERKHFHS